MADDIKKGKLNQIKGKAKEADGKLTGSKTQEIKGKAQNTAGKIQEHYGKTKRDIKKAIEDQPNMSKGAYQQIKRCSKAFGEIEESESK